MKRLLIIALISFGWSSNTGTHIEIKSDLKLRNYTEIAKSKSEIERMRRPWKFYNKKYLT